MFTVRYKEVRLMAGIRFLRAQALLPEFMVRGMTNQTLIWPSSQTRGPEDSSQVNQGIEQTD